MMPLSGLQVSCRFRVTLTFDLLTPKVDFLCPCSVDHFTSWHQNMVALFSKYYVHNFGNRWTNRQPENIMPAPAILAWRNYKKLLHDLTDVLLIV